MDKHSKDLLEEVELDELEPEVEEKPKKEVKPVKEPVLETRICVDCQGDGKWDGVICKVCHGSGKIFKDGIVVLAADGQTFVADKGELKV